MKRAVRRGSVLAAAVLFLALLAYGAVLRLAGGEDPPEQLPFASDSAGEPACPVLVLVNERSDNPFGPYLAEILHAEGLSCFRLASISAATGRAPDHVESVLLAEGELTSSEVEWLQQLVEGGGRLVAMRPDPTLTPLLGIEPISGQTSDGFLLTARNNPMTAGIAGGPLQFHGVANHYRTVDADVTAWIVANGADSNGFPGITTRRVGRGLAIAWSFDLARSIAYTRQGNPESASQERDGLDGIRPADMFRGWVDPNRLRVPQADELQRLLTNLLALDLMLPRLWYFPGAVDGMLIATGEAHGSSAAAIDAMLAQVDQLHGHISVYYTPPPLTVAQRGRQRVRWWLAELPLTDRLTGDSSLPSPSDVPRWRAAGHEFGLQPDAERDLAATWRDFTGLGYGPVPPTIRTHRGAWSGWVDSARDQAAHGFHLNLDYHPVGPAVLDDKSGPVLGYLTGSGLPMRFVDEHGRILAIYQQATQLVDEDLIAMPWEVPWATLQADAAGALAAEFVRRAPYVAISVQFHIEAFAPGSTSTAAATTWLNDTLGAATARGFPIWNAQQWLRFTEVRDQTALEALHWDEHARRLDFHVRSKSAPDVELTVLVPLWLGTTKLARVQVDDQEARSHIRRVGGIVYGGVSVPAGPHTVTATYGN